MNIRSLILGAALGLGLAGAANAATFEVFEDLQVPTVVVGGLTSSSFDLAYDTTGWASIESATLWLQLGDNGDTAAETAVTIAGAGPSLAFVTTLDPSVDGLTWYVLGSVLDLVVLGGTGLTGTVHGLGDFMYGGARLVVEFTPVPEASELWLLAAGLLAVGGIVVKRKSFDQA